VDSWRDDDAGRILAVVLRIATIATIVATFAVAAPASAAEFVVNVTTDAHDQALGDGLCRDATGHCTLRAALEQANGQAGADTVTVPAGTFSANEELVITSVMTVKGAGARATVIDGASNAPALDVFGAGAATLSGLAITGAATGLLVRDGGSADGDGIVIRDNIFPEPSGAGNTAGLFVSGTHVTLRDSAIVGNAGGSSSSLVLGGGVYNGGGTVVLRRTTVAGNTASDGPSHSRNTLGGGIFTTGGALTLDHVTLTGNSAPSGNGGNVYSTGSGSVIVEDSIIAAGSALSGANCSGTAPQTRGRNLAGDTSCEFGSGQIVADPLLGPLGDNGGPTDTLVPGVGSPVIDAAAACSDGAADQRGAPAPVGTGCDIGAVEIGAGRSVTLQSSAAEVGPGAGVTLIATATNAGFDASQGTTVSFDLPIGASADLIYGSNGTCAGTSCSLGALPPGGTATVILALRLPATPGPATTTARISGATPDSSAADDTASVTTNVIGAAPSPSPSASTTPFPAADRKAPVVSKVAVAGRLRAGRQGKLAFTLSESATVRVTVRRNGKILGVIKGGGAKGAHTLRISKHLVRPGRLQLTVTATDTAGNRSVATRLKVRVRT
jgi:hypothetical protein